MLDYIRQRVQPFFLTINAYDKDEVGSPKDFMIVQYNPDSLQIEYNIDWQSPQGLGTTGSNLSFANNKPEKIKFKLLFAESDVDLGLFQSKLLLGDNIYKTGNRLSNRISTNSYVNYAVEKFLTLTTQKLSSEHRPYYLRLKWGNVLVRPKGTLKDNKPEVSTQKTYPCQLESVDVNYTLFSREGTPLRAELDCVFIEHNQLQDHFADEYSPDVTHAKTLKAGDQLSEMTQEIYEKANWYPKVARVNKLDSVRQVPSHQVLNFPPLK